MSVFRRSEFNAVLRGHFPAFVEQVFATVSPGDEFKPSWHIDAMAEALRKVHAGEVRNLLITMPPRNGKSITTSVAFPAWALGHDPSRKYLVASYGDKLAALHARDFRKVMESDWYRALFPRAAQAKRNVELDYETLDNGSRRAVTVGGSITGIGANTVIIDDLMKAGDGDSAAERQRAKDFFDQTLYTRLNNKSTGSIIAIQQRLHQDDFAAYLIDKGGFTHLNLRAIAEEDEAFDLGYQRVKRRRRGEALFEAQEPLETLAEIRTRIGNQAFEAQYQQNPTAAGGNLLRAEWFHTYDEAPERERVFYLVQSWDVAVTATPQSDFSVCTTWGYVPPCWYLLDLCRIRLEYPELLARARLERRRWQPDQILIEKAGAGRPFFDDFRRDQIRATPDRADPPYRVIGWQPRSDKLTRLVGQGEKLQSGLIKFPRSAEFMPGFKAELLAAPNGTYDDQADSFSQFGEWISNGRFHRGLDARGYPTWGRDGRPL